MSFSSALSQVWFYNNNFISNGNKEHDNFDSIVDGDIVYKIFNNFIIENNHIVTLKNRCKGMCIVVKGDCHIKGTISMTARGANTYSTIDQGKGVAFDVVNYKTIIDTAENLAIYDYKILDSDCGNGAGRRYHYNYGNGVSGYTGSAGTGRGFGGGGSGAARGAAKYSYSGAGAKGSPFSGGSGGGGAYGGGSINIFHKNNFINNGTIRANGGIGYYYAPLGIKGGNGGAGTITVTKI